MTSRVAADALSLVLRVALAAPFFLSGRTKVVPGTLLSISDATYYLFETDYSAVPLPPHFAAVAASVSELVFPILLLVGLGTRFAALALIGMTLVIQIFVYPDAFWSVHLQWLTLALAILVLGPGRASLDAWVTNKR